MAKKIPQDCSLRQRWPNYVNIYVLRILAVKKLLIMHNTPTLIILILFVLHLSFSEHYPLPPIFFPNKKSLGWAVG